MKSVAERIYPERYFDRERHAPIGHHGWRIGKEVIAENVAASVQRNLRSKVSPEVIELLRVFLSPPQRRGGSHGLFWNDLYVNSCLFSAYFSPVPRGAQDL